MARAAGGGATAPSSSFALERTLDRTIECLSGGASNRGEVRAQLIEARRLRSSIANWRSIPPSPAQRDVVLEHVRKLAASVGVPFPSLDEIEAPAPAVPPTSRVDAKPVPKPETARSPARRDEEETEPLDFQPHFYSLDTAANRKAAPVPPPEAPVPEYGDAPGDGPAHSEDEPTRAFNSGSVRPPPDLEAELVPAPAPWPVDEPPGHDGGYAPKPPLTADRISSIIADAKPAAPPEAARRAPAASSPDLAPPDELPADVAAGPRILTYEFDAEGDDLSVPRTQIVAHAVKLSDPVNPLLAVLTDPYSPRTDAYRTLRRKLAGLPNARVLAVTSAHPGEGKTVFALNLALALRESARSRVLVIEANLRAPIMAKLLGFETPEGFFAQLKRHEEDPRAPWVVAEPLPKLHVMAIDPNGPSERLLDPVSFSAGMERLKQAGYEYVIVDSPPVLGSLDCNVISDAVDAMILTALPMKSLRREMRKAVEQLEPAPILGVVVLEA